MTIVQLLSPEVATADVDVDLTVQAIELSLNIISTGISKVIYIPLESPHPYYGVN